VQPLTAAGGELVPTVPLPRFEQHADLASVVLEPDPDGLVRSMPNAWRIGAGDVESVFAAAAGDARPERVPLDFAVLPSSFAYVSYSDLLNAAIDFASLEGKDVYVGATAMELRDVVAVPVYRSLPGVVVQALAPESARAGVLRNAPDALLLALLAAWAAGCTA